MTGRTHVRMLVVAPEPVFTPRGTPFSVYHRLAVAAELGVEADLLTYEEGADPDLPGLAVHRIPRVPLLGPVRIGPSFGKLVRDGLMVLWTFGLLIRRRPDVVHAHEEAVFWCRALKPFFGFRLIYDMHSSLPQQLTNFDFTSSRLLIGLFERLENSALDAADAVLTISPALADVARERMSDPTRHVLLENCVLDRVRLKESGPDSRSDDRPQVPDSASDSASPWPDEWTGAEVIVYAGTLEPYQGVDLLLEAFARVRRRRPDARLLVVGGNDTQISGYRAMADGLDLGDACRFTGSVPQPTARALMERADVLVSSRTRGTNTPLKIYELLASGIVFVATRIESHTQVLDDSVCVLAEPEPEAFAEGLARALEGGDGIRRRAERARRLYEERYSRDAYRARLAAILDRVAPPGKGIEVSAS